MNKAAASALIVAGLTISAATQSNSSAWPQWRGPNRDGHAAGFTAPKVWPERLTSRWKAEVGLGYATPLLVGDRLYVFARQADNEVMAALDAASG